LPLTALNHYTIRAQDVRQTLDFYIGVLGMHDGPRPKFDNPGHWLYCGDNAVIHVVSKDLPDVFVGRVHDTGGPSDAALLGSGSVDHIAFAGTDHSEALERVRARGIAYKENAIPEMGLLQIFVEDPNGLTVEMQFPAASASAGLEDR
jgi:catechol 2,3-dioxygenase-like lactoylglutathione lyase family enzyme